MVMAMHPGHKSVLLVHTQDRLRKQIAQCLANAGFTSIISCVDGESAIDMLLHRVFDVVICDVNLDNLDGWQLARLIRSGALNTSKEAPVFVVSDSYSEHLSRVTAQEFEVNAFVANSAIDSLPVLIGKAFGNTFVEMHTRRLLVIEDYADTVALIERTLAADFKIESAVNGRQGLEAWRAGRHDLVLLDVMLPGMSGEDVLREIRALDSHQPVVMMTAHTSGELAARLFRLGCVDFVVKPFRTSMLRKVCHLAISRDDYMTSHQQMASYQSALLEEKERVRVILDSIGDGIVSSDKNGNADYINRRAMELINWHPPLSFQYASDKLLHSTDHEVAPVRDEKRNVEISHAMVSHYGRDCHLDIKTTPIYGHNGEFSGRVSILHDVTTHANIADQLRYESMHDPLTGLLNRAGFSHAMETALEEIPAFDVRHALCFLDLDKFKQVNDECGHDVGDRFLRAICAILQKHIRKGSDALARLGGDEFALLLKNCSIKKAETIAMAICRDVAGFELAHEGRVFHIGVSIGVAAMEDAGVSMESIVKKADAACYAAKNSGRGRVVIA